SLPVPLVVAGPTAEESSLPSTMTGTFGDFRRSFLGFPAAKALPAPAADVLARLDGAPWIAGRGHGKGRIAAVAAPDLWRVGGPGSGRAPYEELLGRVVAWLEGPRAGVGVELSQDLRRLDGRELPVPDVAGLAVDPVDPYQLLPEGRGRRRVDAARENRPFL